MGVRCRGLIVLLTLCALALANKVNKTKNQSDNLLFQDADYEASDGKYDHEEINFNEDKPCPRDCICSVSQGYRIAKCNRLEIGTQKFGDDITDLVIENVDPKYPIQLDDFIFKKLGLHQISTVKIVNSTISSIGLEAFSGLHELYAVTLSGNRLKYLDPKTFTNNKKLLLLTLANNPLKFPAKGSEEHFLNTSSVQELDVSNCNIQFITENAFKYMPGLMYLNVAGNSLTNLDRKAFRNLLDLEELDMSDNNIKMLPDDIFSENTELATLHIQRNPIDTVYGLQVSDLLTLNAGQTSIKFVGPSMFNGMTYIANLNLSGNGIEKIHNLAFNKLVELNYLDLSFNDLDYISSALIQQNIELEIFKISSNPKLTHLPENGFECSAEQFNIFLFDASNCGLEEISDNALSTFTALSQLNLAGNKLKSLSPNVLTKCPKLVNLNLADNKLTALDNKIFAQNKDLAKLNLQGNPLKIISAQVFTFTPALTVLDLSGTELKSLWIEEKTEENFLKNVHFLNISHNHINEVKQNQLASMHSLRSLDISNNPLVCNREFENLMTWLNNKTVLPTSNSASIANLAKDAKEESTDSNTWESLARKVCGDNVIIPNPVITPSVSDEEIWEKIDKDADGNFDLKDTLDDAKVANDNFDDKTEKLDNYDDDKDDDDDDKDDADDDDADDDAGEDYDDDGNVDVKVKLVEDKPKDSPKLGTSPPSNGNVEVDIKLMENDIYDDIEEVYVPASVIKGEHGQYEYLWPVLFALLGALLLMIAIAKTVMVICSKRDRQVRYNSAIIAAMSNPSRTKKDCGLVYQQLSEDLTGPTTPKLSRYAPLRNVTVNASNLSYESSTFHHSNIVPEAV